MCRFCTSIFLGVSLLAVPCLRAEGIGNAEESDSKTPTEREDASRSDMVLVPGGEFEMGDTFSEGYGEELPVHAVYVDPFYMDVCEVTNQQYADGLNWAWRQGGLITVADGVVFKNGSSYVYCDTSSSSPYSRITWDGSTFGVESGMEAHPVTMITWLGAAAYANWRSAMEGKPPCYDLSTWTCSFGSGYRLPTEAEWERAARGGEAGHRFPWLDSETIQHARANYNSSSSYPYDTSPTRGYHPDFVDGSVPHTAPVGYFAPNTYGLYDVCGNVQEWCNDGYSMSYYAVSPYENPHGPAGGNERVTRGGSWLNLAIACRVASRGHSPNYARWMYTGLRCVLAEPPAAARGDLNCDGVLNAFDIDPFVLALTSAPAFEAYYAVYPDCDGMLADINCDGAVNAFDIDPFVQCLTGGGCPPCP